MTAEKTNKKENKTKSEGSGPAGSGIMDVMGTCCSGEAAFADCSCMMKGFIKKMTRQSCCSPKIKDTGTEEGKNERADQ